MPQPAQLTSCFSPRDPKPWSGLHPSMGTEVTPPSPGTQLTSGLLIYGHASARRMGLCRCQAGNRMSRHRRSQGAVYGVVGNIPLTSQGLSTSLNQAIKVTCKAFILSVISSPTNCNIQGNADIDEKTPGDGWGRNKLLSH